jgi:L-fuconolactonase
LVTAAQIHLGPVETPERPGPTDKTGGSEPHRSNGYSAEEMLAELAAAGVDRAVIHPPGWDGDDNT